MTHKDIILTTITPEDKEKYDKELLENVYISELLKQREDLQEINKELLEALLEYMPDGAEPLNSTDRAARAAIAKATGGNND